MGAVAMFEFGWAMLPASKDEFPKCLYLDQNKWIDLARAHYGRDDGKPYKDALQAVRTALAGGTVLVPFSLVNALEGMIHRDGARRERLARFMVDLSGNISILPEFAVRPTEIRNLLRRTFNRGDEVPVRPGILARGLFNAFGKQLRIGGGRDEVNAAALEYAHTPEIAVQLLLEAADDRTSIEQTRAWEAARVSAFEQARQRGADAGLSLQQRRAVEVVSVGNQKGSPVHELLQSAQEMGIPAKEFFDRFMTDPAAFINFAHTIPTFDVLSTLLLARDQDLVRNIDPNDLRDLLQLSVAVPYSNIIVVENYWGHQIRATKLAEKYGTTVLCDTREILDALSVIGCIK